MKVDTIEQFKILEFIRANFEMQHIIVKLIDNNNIEVTDSNKDTIIISYKDNKIVF